MADQPVIVAQKPLELGVAEQPFNRGGATDVDIDVQVRNGDDKDSPGAGAGEDNTTTFGTTPSPIWRDTLHPLSHEEDCPFSERNFQDKLTDMLLTPNKFEGLLIRDNRKQVEEGNRQGKKYGGIHKKPTNVIANNPFVVEYLMGQRKLVTEHRQDNYNLCDCVLKGQSKQRTPKTIFPSDFDRQLESSRRDNTNN